MAYPALKMDERYTWDDYQSWPDEERYELIGAAALQAVTQVHRYRVRNLGRRCGACLFSGTGTILAA